MDRPPLLPPLTVMMSEMPRTPLRRTSSATLKASFTGTLLSMAVAAGGGGGGAGHSQSKDIYYCVAVASAAAARRGSGGGRH